MPVIPFVVAYAGAAAGTAITGAVVGTAAYAAAAAVGAGIAMGTYAEVSGKGNFDDGFWSGVAGNVIGQTIGAGFNAMSSAPTSATYGAPSGMSLSSTPSAGDFGSGIDYSLSSGGTGIGDLNNVSVPSSLSTGIDVPNTSFPTDSLPPTVSETYGSNVNTGVSSLSNPSIYEPNSLATNPTTLDKLYTPAYGDTSATQLPEITVKGTLDSPGYTAADFAGEGTGEGGYGPQTSSTPTVGDYNYNGKIGNVADSPSQLSSILDKVKGVVKSPSLRNMYYGMNAVNQYGAYADLQKQLKGQADSYAKELDWNTWMNGQGGNNLRQQASRMASQGRTGMGPALFTQAQQQFNSNRAQNLQNLYGLQQNAMVAGANKRLAPMASLGRMFPVN
jgi:hypothetical protein